MWINMAGFLALAWTTADGGFQASPALHKAYRQSNNSALIVAVGSNASQPTRAEIHVCPLSYQ
jgi:hypothetical protein